MLLSCPVPVYEYLLCREPCTRYLLIEHLDKDERVGILGGEARRQRVGEEEYSVGQH